VVSGRKFDLVDNLRVKISKKFSVRYNQGKQVKIKDKRESDF